MKKLAKHPFVSTVKSKGRNTDKCSSCGRSRVNEIHYWDKKLHPHAFKK